MKKEEGIAKAYLPYGKKRGGGAPNRQANHGRARLCRSGEEYEDELEGR